MRNTIHSHLCEQFLRGGMEDFADAYFVDVALPDGSRTSVSIGEVRVQVKDFLKLLGSNTTVDVRDMEVYSQNGKRYIEIRCV